MGNFFKDTITMFLFNKATQTFDRFVIKNVYFRHTIGTKMTADGIMRISSGAVTIPLEYAQIGNLNLNEFMYSNTWNVNKKSYIVNGEVENKPYNDLVKDYHLFRIIKVADNRKGGLKHLKIEVDE